MSERDRKKLPLIEGASKAQLYLRLGIGHKLLQANLQLQRFHQLYQYHYLLYRMGGRWRQNRFFRIFLEICFFLSHITSIEKKAIARDLQEEDNVSGIGKGQIIKKNKNLITKDRQNTNLSATKKQVNQIKKRKGEIKFL